MDKVVIMLKNSETGAIEKEFGSVSVAKNGNLLVNIFGYEIDGNIQMSMKVTTDKDVSNWEFFAIYDHYDMSVYEGKLISIIEDDDCYNPTWEMRFDFGEDIIDVEDKISELLTIHFNELKDVYEVINDKREEYSEHS